MAPADQIKILQSLCRLHLPPRGARRSGPVVWKPGGDGEQKRVASQLIWVFLCVSKIELVVRSGERKLKFLSSYLLPPPPLHSCSFLTVWVYRRRFISDTMREGVPVGLQSVWALIRRRGIKLGLWWMHTYGPASDCGLAAAPYFSAFSILFFFFAWGHLQKCSRVHKMGKIRWRLFFFLLACHIDSMGAFASIFPRAPSRVRNKLLMMRSSLHALVTY